MTSGEKDKLLASRKPSDLLPQPTPQELQFLDIVYEGSVDKLLAWLQLNQVCIITSRTIIIIIILFNQTAAATATIKVPHAV